MRLGLLDKLETGKVERASRDQATGNKWAASFH
jgi:hypothetical protein